MKKINMKWACPVLASESEELLGGYIISSLKKKMLGAGEMVKNRDCSSRGSGFNS